MQKNVVIQLRIGNATGRNILAGILKRIKGTDNCTIRIASDAEDFRRLSASASAAIAERATAFIAENATKGIGLRQHQPREGCLQESLRHDHARLQEAQQALVCGQSEVTSDPEGPRRVR